MSLALKQYEAIPVAGKKSFTYADYLRWDEDIRAEIIDGIAYMMAPPNTLHQRISMNLSRLISQFLEGKTCEVYAAPFGVRLFPKDDKSDDNIVEPDISVICDKSKIDEQGCNGAPDFIIEILSSSSRRKDKYIKYELYLKALVREYWVVSPENREIDVHLLENNRYITRLYGINEHDAVDNTTVPEVVPVSVLPGLEIDVRDIFK